MIEKRIFNLQFEEYVNSMVICGYEFYRVENYEENLKKLQHPASTIREFVVPLNTGEHAETAYVKIHGKEQSSVLEWRKDKTALDDILLLLSMFTGRHVFTIEEDFNNEKEIIKADPRLASFGKILRASLPLEIKMIDCKDIGVQERKVGLGLGIEKAYKLIQSNEWKEKYNNGYFLFFARNAFKTDYIDLAFIQCWTIWEHLYSLHNIKCKSEDKIRRMDSFKKISYLVREYELCKHVKGFNKKEIEEIKGIRNRLIHYGKYPKEKENSEMDKLCLLFIHLTEIIVALILGLVPLEPYNTIEGLKEEVESNTGV